MWALFAVAIVVKVVFPGWGIVVVIMLSPLVLGLPALGAAALTSLLVGRRRLRPEPPRWLLSLASLLGLGMLVSASVFPDSGDTEGSTSVLLTLLGSETAAPWMETVTVVAWCVAAGASAVAIVVWVRDKVHVRRARRVAA